MASDSRAGSSPVCGTNINNLKIYNIMKFTIRCVYDTKFRKEVEINTLEDLQNLKERLNYNLESFSDKNPDHHSIWEPPYRIVVDFEEHEIRIYDWYI